MGRYINRGRERGRPDREGRKREQVGDREKEIDGERIIEKGERNKCRVR